MAEPENSPSKDYGKMEALREVCLFSSINPDQGKNLKIPVVVLRANPQPPVIFTLILIDMRPANMILSG